jgi:SAM-dependent methyltransferase
MGDVPDVGELAWGALDVVSKFGTRGFSDAGEAAAFEALDRWVHGDVLDLGVGGGRTTGLLGPRARSYVGVDLSPQMIALTRRRFPATDLREGDAVDLAGLADAAFDLVVFSYNGLDALDHARRAAALASMARVTRPDGRVLFSSLNLDGVSFDERLWRVAGGLLSPRMRYHLGQAARHPRTVTRSLHNWRRTRHDVEDGHGWGRRALRAHEFGSSCTSRRWRRPWPRPPLRASRSSRRTAQTAVSSPRAPRTPTPTMCTSGAVGSDPRHHLG